MDLFLFLINRARLERTRGCEWGEQLGKACAHSQFTKQYIFILSFQNVLQNLKKIWRYSVLKAWNLEVGQCFGHSFVNRFLLGLVSSFPINCCKLRANPSICCPFQFLARVNFGDLTACYWNCISGPLRPLPTKKSKWHLMRLFCV